jgi:hypothetical protein
LLPLWGRFPVTWQTLDIAEFLYVTLLVVKKARLYSRLLVAGQVTVCIVRQRAATEYYCIILFLKVNIASIPDSP